MKYVFGISPRGVFEATQPAHRHTSDRHCFWSKTILCLLLNSYPHWSYCLLASYSLTVSQHECHLPYGTPWAPLTTTPQLPCHFSCLWPYAVCPHCYRHTDICWGLGEGQGAASCFTGPISSALEDHVWYDISDTAPDRRSEAVEGSGAHESVTQLQNSASLLILVRPWGIWSQWLSPI